jgi:ring-1,2-phenylacetyl-CoA epoxidase subunit PaaE
MLTFHPLQVSEIRPEAQDAICITLKVPDPLKRTFQFSPGQHVGLRANIDGNEVRRTYSICSDSDDQGLQIGLRVHEKGSMSRYLSSAVQAGDVLEVMPPAGRFFVNPEPTAAKTYCAFASGSGITPILGILKNLLRREPNSRFILFYGNRTISSIMFAEELHALKDRYMQRLSLHFLLSREPQEFELLNGRLDAKKVLELSRTVFDPLKVDAYLLCGPDTMIGSIRGALLQLSVDPTRIHYERYGTVNPARRDPSSPVEPASPTGMTSKVTINMDGRRRAFVMSEGADSILEAAEKAGFNLPYSCRAGVCSTCRARVTRGQVTMKVNYSLEQAEVEAGYVLCCQALPASQELELDYDER